ncbi:MAG: hypothetical protein J6J24_01505 [Clostridia bacterium]|nr:hypothetical protein [Clostridia bacterium]
MELHFMEKGIFKNHTIIFKQNFLGVELKGTAIVYGTNKIRTFSQKEFTSYSLQWQDAILAKAVSYGLAKNLSKEVLRQYMQGKKDVEAMKKVAEQTFQLLPDKFFQSTKAVRALQDAISNTLIEDLQENKYNPNFKAHSEKFDIMNLWELNSVCHESLMERAEKENLPLPQGKEFN